MKLTEQNVYVVDDYREIEILMAEFFNDKNFSLVAELEAHNDTRHFFNVEENNQHHEMELNEARHRHETHIPLYDFGVGAVLEYYAHQGRIPFGKYLVNISW